MSDRAPSPGELSPGAAASLYRYYLQRSISLTEQVAELETVLAGQRDEIARLTEALAGDRADPGAES